MQEHIKILEQKLASFPPAKTDSRERVDLLNELAWEIALSATKRSWELTQEALRIAEKIGYELGQTYALRNLGYCQMARSNLEEALKHSKEALTRFRNLKDDVGRATALDNLAIIFWRLGSFDKALRYSLSALELNRAIDNKKGEAWALHNIAVISFEVGDQDRAIKNYKNAHKIFQEIDYKVGESRVLGGLGEVFQKIGKFEEALQYYHGALKISEDYKIPLAVSRALTDIGTVYEKLGDVDKAFEYHTRSLKCFDEFENKESKAVTLLNLGRLYGQSGDSSKALEYLHEALAMVDRSQAKPTAFRVRQALFEIYESQGDFRKALEHHKAFHRIKEEVYNDESSTKLRNLQTRAAVEQTEKEAEIENLRVVHSARMNLLENLAAGLAHEVNSPLGVINSYAQISELSATKLKKEINTLNLEDHESTQNSMTRLIGILANSSKSIARAGNRISELIDGLQAFASLDQGQMQLVDVQQQIENTLNLLSSRLSENIDVVTDFGDLPKIQAYPRDLDQVFMTLLLNAFDAIETKGQIRIRTTANKDQILVRIADTGKGIPKARLDKIFEIGFGHKDSKVRMRFGLANTYNIVQKHYGEINVSSEVGCGTEFVIKLPLRIDGNGTT